MIYVSDSGLHVSNNRSANLTPDGDELGLPDGPELGLDDGDLLGADLGDELGEVDGLCDNKGNVSFKKLSIKIEIDVQQSKFTYVG